MLYAHKSTYMRSYKNCLKFCYIVLYLDIRRPKQLL